MTTPSASTTTSSRLTLRRATPADIPLIQKLTSVIWPATYSSILSPGQIDYMIEMMYSDSSLRHQMEELHHEFMICYDGEEPVAFASYSNMGERIFKLHKIYVLPEYQGKGIGRYIVDAILREVAAQGGVALDLNVNRSNPARFFYEKLGFVILREEDIDIGGGYWMNDYVMRKRLDSSFP